MLKGILLYLGFLLLAGLWRSRVQRRRAPAAPPLGSPLPRRPAAPVLEPSAGRRREAAARPGGRPARPPRTTVPPVSPVSAASSGGPSPAPAGSSAVPSGAGLPADGLQPENLVQGLILSEVLGSPRARRPWLRR